jgi:hypothetical protein
MQPGVTILSLPVMFTQDNGDRVLINWDSVAYVSPAGDDESKGSVIHFSALAIDGATALGVREGLEAIERRLQTATRA